MVWSSLPQHTMTCTASEEDWIADSKADQRVPGYISGYVRRFWQVGYSRFKVVRWLMLIALRHY